MRYIAKILILSLLFYSQLFACNLCKLNVPITNVTLKINAKQDYIKLDITWEFSKEFSSEALFSYDKNQNKIYEKDELEEANKSVYEYLKNDSYLTFIKYMDKNTNIKESTFLKSTFLKSNFKYENQRIIYSYSLKSDISIKDDNLLYIRFYDRGGNFDFNIIEHKLKGITPNSLQKDKNSLKVYLYDKVIPKIVKETNTTNIEIKKDIKEDGDILDGLSKLLTNLKNNIKELLNDIKSNNSLSSYLWLLLFSFLYGIIHAIGPGHGKSLVSAYFLNENRSLIKAFNISALIGVVHTFSAFILTFVIYYILNVFLSQYFKDIDYIATKLSAVIIIAIGIYLLYKKITNNKKFTFQAAKNISFIKPVDNTHSQTVSCGCNACKTTSTNLGVILAAGIVPCAGTVTIFIFTMSMGLYFVGFLSAVFMSLGMSLIIFIMAYISIKVRDSSNRNEKIKKVLEYGSLIFILLLGFVLLAS